MERLRRKLPVENVAFFEPSAISHSDVRIARPAVGPWERFRDSEEPYASSKDNLKPCRSATV